MMRKLFTPQPRTLLLSLMIGLLILTPGAELLAQEDRPDVPVADGTDPWVSAEDTLGQHTVETSYYDLLSELREQAVSADAAVTYAADTHLTDHVGADGEAMDPPEDGSVRLPGNSKATFSIDVPEAGSWHLAFTYRVPTLGLQEPRANVRINGDKYFAEMDNLSFPTAWATIQADDPIDRYGNEIYPTADRIYRDFTHTLNISMFSLTEPLLFPFTEGINELTLELGEFDLELIDIQLRPTVTRPTYAEYLAENGQSDPSAIPFADSEIVIKEGELPDEKSQPHIRGERTKDVHFTPYDSRRSLINVLAPTMWEAPGSRISYTFDAPTDGWYRIGFRYQQGTKQEAPVYKRVLIDGEIPFEAMESYPFAFTRNNVTNHWLSDGTNDYAFYLEAGTHTLDLESTASLYYEAYETLNRAIAEMNAITLDIRMITGNRADPNRDWAIELYIPDIKPRLEHIADSLKGVFDDLTGLSGQEEVSEWNDLMIIHDQLRVYIDHNEGLDRLVNNLDGFSQADGSLAQQISNAIESMLNQPMSIDQVYVVGQDTSGVSTSPNVLKRAQYAFEKLIYSFTREDGDLEIQEDALNIWINRPVTHIDVLREMINQEYPDRDININLSAMPDENRLLLSIIAGEAPDAVLGLSTAKPYDFALRGAAYDLSQFDDFDEMVSDFTAEMFVPFVHDGGIYGLPETATFHVLFYRTDILAQLGLEPPRTWEDLIEIIPALDRQGMNVQTMIAAADGFKPFGATVPFIQQFNGSIYSEDGMSAAFSDPKTIEAFQLLTDLYIRYNLPHRIVNFYNNFKSGATPIGISELNTYTLLKYAAPEINGQWAIGPNLGRITDTGEFVNTQPDITSGVMITEQSRKKAEAWEFMKWWMSEETQLRFGNELQMRFGREFIWNSANLNAVAQVPYIEQEDRAIVVEQIRIAKEVPRHPAYFQVERELSNAWNTVVFDGTSVREALDRATLTTNRMMRNKLAEFGYIDADGNPLKPLQMARAEDIEGLGNFIDATPLTLEELEELLVRHETDIADTDTLPDTEE